MIERKVLNELLETAVYAPSGDNSQPWSFEVKNDTLYIFSLADKDNPKFNFRGRGTLIAHGALIENILIYAPTLGLKPVVELFPQIQEPNCTAKISFEQIQPWENLLGKFIKERCTNRKKYSSELLTQTSKQDIIRSAAEVGLGRVELVEEENQKKLLGQAVSINEVVMLEDKELHDLFFGDVRWTKEEENKFKTGLYLKTMELEKPKEIAFRILKSWKNAKFLTKFGLAKFIAKENSKIYSSGGALGVIIIPNEDKAFLSAGKVMQRIWLKATSYGLSLQPITGIIYLAQRVNANEAQGFSETHISQIKKAYSEICSVFPVQNNEVMAMLFRMGKSAPASSHSSKLIPKIKYF